MSYHRPDQKKLQLLNDIANKLRIHSIESTNASKSGYVGRLYEVLQRNRSSHQNRSTEVKNFASFFPFLGIRRHVHLWPR